MENTVSDEAWRKDFPFQNRFFDVGEYKLHYIDEGNGPILLLLHACPFWSFEFRHLIAKFRETHRVIALDQMGFGLSDKPLDLSYRVEIHADHLEQFIHELELKNITLVMHGRGAVIGMAYATRDPENISGYVALNAMSFSDYELPLRLQLCRIKWLGPKIIMNLNIFLRDVTKLPEYARSAYLYPFPTNKSKIALLRFIEDIPCAPEDESAMMMCSIESLLWKARRRPVCLIWAKNDWLYPMSCYRHWLKYFPKAHHYLIDGGRCSTEAEPERINQILEMFFNRHQL